MSRRNKLQKFAEMQTLPNVFENVDTKNPTLSPAPGQVVSRSGKWCAAHFANDHPLVLELACGRGEYTVELARMYPIKNYIGVDVKGARIWKGARIALSENLHNVAFLRTRIEQIGHFFAPGEVAEIWITFPDPFLRDSKSNRRLTSPWFLQQYRKILASGAIMHLKTDDPNLYHFTLQTIGEQPDYQVLFAEADIYSKPLPWPDLAIQTHYERMHLAAGKSIKYIRFQYLPARTPPQPESG
jgi:tRNA (guanine-N7-)-methyltransferase